MTVEKRPDIKVPVDCLKEESGLLQLAYEERGIETHISADLVVSTDAVDFLTQSHRIND